jgi:copper resistance protein D
MTTFELLVVSRWIYFTSVYVVFGSTFFWFYMGGHGTPEHLPRTWRATGFLTCIAAPLAAISGTAWLMGILANMVGGFAEAINPENLRLFFLETQFGLVAETRLLLFAVAIAIAFAPWRGRFWLAGLALVGALLLLTQAWLGHAAEGGATLYGALMIATYGIHMLAAAAWVGGLPPLLFALVEERHFSPEAVRDWTLDILSRYSLMAMVAVTLIVATGIGNAAFRVAGSFDKLFWTDYGNVLAAKVLAVVVMLVLAYFNRFVAMPRLRIAALKDERQIARLRASVSLELVLGMVVLGVAAVLGITPPPQ